MGEPDIFSHRALLEAPLIGLGVALLLWALSWAVLPKDERRLARVALLLVGLFVVTQVASLTVDPDRPMARVLRLSALFFVLTSVARSSFLILVHALVTRRLGYRLPRIVEDLTQAGVYLLVGFVVLRAAGVEPTSLLATSALLTAVIGLSLQETLGNLFAGLAIQGERPFDVGDWIQFDENPRRVGRVTEINWRATKLETLDRVMLTVPNGVLAKAPITNFSSPSRVVRRSVTVHTPQSVAPGDIEQLLLGAVHQVEGVLTRPAPSALVTGYTERGAEWALRYFIEDFGLREVIDHRVRCNVWYALSRAEIEVPPPRQLVTLSRERRTDRSDPVQRSRRLETLQAVEFLSPLSSDAMDELARLSRTWRFGPGEVIVRQGELGAEWYVIRSGEVSVQITRGRREIEVARLGAKDFFGEMSLMTGEPRTATVLALTDCEVVVVDKTAFKSTIEVDPKVLERISEHLAVREAEIGRRTEAQGSANPAENAPQLLGRIRRFFHIDS